MAFFNTRERTLLCLIAIVTGSILGLTTTGFYVLAEALDGLGGGGPHAKSAEEIKQDRDEKTLRKTFFLVVVCTGSALVVIGVTGIYKMHSPQAIARRRANELPRNTKPGTPDSETSFTDPVVKQHGTSPSSPGRDRNEEAQA